jgi:hypothetical protein
MRGDQHLRRAIRRFRMLRQPQPVPATPPPVALEPTTAFEAILLQRIDDLEDRIVKLESRVNWLLVTIVGACLVFILRTLFPYTLPVSWPGSI